MGKRFGMTTTVFACTLALAACGETGEVEGTIPQDAGSQILAKIDEVEAHVDAGECDEAQAKANEIATAIASLPEEEVDGELRQTLITASGQLAEQTQDPEQCEPLEEPPPTGGTGETGVLEGEEG